MEEATVVFSWAASALGILGFLAVVIQQIIFYRRDSKTMDRIEGSISSGSERLEQGHNGIRDRMEREHQDIRALVNDKVLPQITDIDKRLIHEFAEQKAKQTYLQGNEHVILESVNNLKAFADVMSDLKKENLELKEKNRELAAENRLCQERIGMLERNQRKQQSFRDGQRHEMEQELEL